jgi:putative endonuclease
MPTYWVYLLQCADGTLYAGWTTDLERRLSAHNAGRGSRYTRGRRPVSIIYREECASESEARRREIALKRMGRAQKLRLIEREEWGVG